MTTGTALWLIVAAVSAVLYFGIAAVVSVNGMKDLWRLLGRGGKGRKPI
jgi:hypothetical protein